MIALTLAWVASAADPDVPVAWDDALADRAPRELTVSVGEGLAFGDTTLARTRVQLGIPIYRRERFGIGITSRQDVNAVVVGDEGRFTMQSGSTRLTVQTWFAPGANPATYHAIVIGGGGPNGSLHHLVHPDDAWYHLSLGYDGYYDAGDHLDVSFAATLGLGVPPDGYLAPVTRSHLTLFWSPGGAEQIAIVGGVDGALGVVDAQLGARWRPDGGSRSRTKVELGAAVVAPIYTLTPIQRELPLWPIVDARLRW